MLINKGKTRKSILLIDDDVNELAITSSVLLDEGYHVLVAEDGITGYNRAIFAKPDLIILDIMMPGIDGYDVSSMLRGNRHTAHIPILFKSCKCDSASVLASIKVGVDDYVVKPCCHVDLLKHVRSCLGLTRLDSIQRLQRFLTA